MRLGGSLLWYAFRGSVALRRIPLACRESFMREFCKLGFGSAQL